MPLFATVVPSPASSQCALSNVWISVGGRSAAGQHFAGHMNDECSLGSSSRAILGSWRVWRRDENREDRQVFMCAVCCRDPCYALPGGDSDASVRKHCYAKDRPTIALVVARSFKWAGCIYNEPLRCVPFKREFPAPSSCRIDVAHPLLIAIGNKQPRLSLRDDIHIEHSSVQRMESWQPSASAANTCPRPQKSIAAPPKFAKVGRLRFAPAVGGSLAFISKPCCLAQPALPLK